MNDGVWGDREVGSATYAGAVLWDSSAARSHGFQIRTQSSLFMRCGYSAVSHTFPASSDEHNDEYQVTNDAVGE